MTGVKTEEDVWRQLAEAELQNRMLKDRLDTMTRLATSYMNDRVYICRQLEQRGLMLTITNDVVEKAK